MLTPSELGNKSAAGDWKLPRRIHCCGQLLLIGLMALLAACQTTSEPQRAIGEIWDDVQALIALEASNPQLAYIENERLEAQTISDGAHGVAWVFANSPASSIGLRYTPTEIFNYSQRVDESPLVGVNNSYPSRKNTVTRLDNGYYFIIVPFLNIYGGIVHVTADSGSNHCKVSSWFPFQNDLVVYVRCFNNAGSPANTRFSMFFYKNSKLLPNHGLAYVWSHNPTTGYYQPHLSAQYNSRRYNEVRRLDRGRYRVTFRDMQLGAGEQNKGGHVQVTAQGTDSTHCKVVHWTQTTTTVNADIHCYNSNGALTDSRFTASFMREPGTAGIRNAFGKRRAHYLWANNATSTPHSSYTPNTFYQAYERATTSVSRVRRTSTGVYTVSLPGLKASDLTGVQVTAYGDNATRCNTSGWYGVGDTTYLQVGCWDTSNNLANSRFTLHYITQ